MSARSSVCLAPRYGVIVRNVFFGTLPLTDPVKVIVAGLATTVGDSVTVTAAVPAPTDLFETGTTVPLLLVSVTGMPPTGAFALRAMVSVDGATPPFTVVGDTENPVSTGAFTVKAATLLLPNGSVPVIVTTVLATTAVVFTLNAAVLLPAVNGTLAGVGEAAPLLLLDSATA